VITVSIETHYVGPDFRIELIANDRESLYATESDSIEFLRCIEGYYVCPQVVEYRSKPEFLATLSQLIFRSYYELKDLKDNIYVYVIKQSENKLAMISSGHRLLLRY
jgi:hypothetical protein